MYELNYKIRVICMEDFEHITNIDEYIGFLYGIISSDHDIETIFIDSILKHADVSLGDLPVFLKRLSGISEIYEQLRSSQLGEQTETEIEQKGGGFTVFFDRYDIWSRKSGKNKH